jgi:hypothetical protein
MHVMRHKIANRPGGHAGQTAASSSSEIERTTLTIRRFARL